MKQQSLLASESYLEGIGDDLDFYETPKSAWDPVAPLIADALRHEPPPVLVEPAAGCGALLGYVLDSIEVYSATAVELHADRYSRLQERFGERAACVRQDFLTWHVILQAAHPRRRALVVLNPPYSKPRKTIGHEFVRASLGLAQPDGFVAALMPLAFAAGKARHALHHEFPSTMCPLSERPGFGGEFESGKKEYSWFLFDLKRPKRAWFPLL